MRPISSAIAARRPGSLVRSSRRAPNAAAASKRSSFTSSAKSVSIHSSTAGSSSLARWKCWSARSPSASGPCEQRAERADRVAAPGAGEPGRGAFPGCDGFVETPRAFESARQTGEGLRIFGAELERTLEALDRGRCIAGCECPLAEFDEPRGRFGARSETRLARGQVDRFEVVPGGDAGTSQAPERRHEGGVEFEGAAVGRRGAGRIAQALLDRLPHPKQQSRLLGGAHGSWRWRRGAPRRAAPTPPTRRRGRAAPRADRRRRDRSGRPRNAPAARGEAPGRQNRSDGSGSSRSSRAQQVGN